MQFFASLIPFGCGFFSSFLFFDDVEEQLAKNALGIVVPLSIVFFSGLILMLYSCFLMSMATFPRRLSRRGQSVLRAYKKRYWPKQRWFQVYGPVPNLDENLALAVALYGLLALKPAPCASDGGTDASEHRLIDRLKLTMHVCTTVPKTVFIE